MTTTNAQRRNARFVGQTTDATQTELLIDGVSGRRLVLPAQSAFAVVALNIVGREVGGDNTLVHHIYTLAIKRSASASTTAFVGTPARTVVGNDTGVADDDAIDVSADTSNGALVIKVTGIADTTFNWTAVAEYDIING